jgi:hypothetical protein
MHYSEMGNIVVLSNGLILTVYSNLSSCYILQYSVFETLVLSSVPHFYVVGHTTLKVFSQAFSYDPLKSSCYSLFHQFCQQTFYPSIGFSFLRIAVRFEVFMVVTMKNAIFWDVTLCDVLEERRSYKSHMA